MNTDQILKVLKNKRDCIKRQSGVEAPDGSVGICDRNCANCDLCLPDDEILEVYDFLIEAYSITEIHINVSKEESEKLFEIINRTARQGVRLTDEYGREHFKGICPYTNIKCEKWTCGICEVEERERKFAEGDTE